MSIVIKFYSLMFANISLSKTSVTSIINAVNLNLIICRNWLTRTSNVCTLPYTYMAAMYGAAMEHFY